MFLILAWIMMAGATWTYLLQREQLAVRETGCPAPSGGSTARSTVHYTALGPAAPAPPHQVEVRVLNATGRQGLAARVAGDLKLEGFVQAMSAGNDVLYPRSTLRCVGQIRFGPNGTQAAHTVSLIVPCAELTRDDRQDSTVDLVLGTTFTTLTPNASLTGNGPSAVLAASHQSRC